MHEAKTPLRRLGGGAEEHFKSVSASVSTQMLGGWRVVEGVEVDGAKSCTATGIMCSGEKRCCALIRRAGDAPRPAQDVAPVMPFIRAAAAGLRSHTSDTSAPQPPTHSPQSERNVRTNPAAPKHLIFPRINS